MTVAHDIDDLVDLGSTVFALFPIFRLDGHLVGQFLMQSQGQLFARHLCRDHPHGEVSNLVFGVEPRALRQFLG